MCIRYSHKEDCLSRSEKRLGFRSPVLSLGNPPCQSLRLVSFPLLRVPERGPFYTPTRILRIPVTYKYRILGSLSRFVSRLDPVFLSVCVCVHTVECVHSGSVSEVRVRHSSSLSRNRIPVSPSTSGVPSVTSGCGGRIRPLLGSPKLSGFSFVCVYLCP